MGFQMKIETSGRKGTLLGTKLKFKNNKNKMLKAKKLKAKIQILISFLCTCIIFDVSFLCKFIFLKLSASECKC